MLRNQTDRCIRLRTAIIALMIISSAIYGCSGGRTQTSETITISGAFALYPMVVRWAEEYQVTHPDVQFDLQAGGAGKGMSDVLAGAARSMPITRCSI